ncbi:MAG: PASTA domain-containing protein, partial [Candidatus Bruticola sp.]
RRNLALVSPLLSKVGLSLGKVVWSVSDKAAGEVISQSPPSGAAAMSDSEVTLEVSVGSSSNNILVHHKLEIFLPGGSEPSEVRVVLLSPEGEEEVYRASHVVNDVVKLWVAGRPGSEAEVYINNKLFMRDKL